MTRWTIIIFFTTFCVTTIVQGQTLAKYKSDSVVITFEKLEIIDTIYVDKDSTERNYAKHYEFCFINSGSASLLISYTGGCDPCFMNKYPNVPIKPGQKSSILIACPGIDGQTLLAKEKNTFFLTKRWKINSNAKNEVSLIVRQVFILKK